MSNEQRSVPEYVRVYDGKTNERLSELADPLNACIHALISASQSGAEGTTLTELVVGEHEDALASLNVIGTLGHFIGTSFNQNDVEKSRTFDLLLETAKSQRS